MALQLSFNKTGAKSPLSIPEKSTGLFGNLLYGNSSSPQQKAITSTQNMTMLPKQTQPVAQKSTNVSSPVKNTTSQSTTPSYKGVAISGTDQNSIQEQMRKIDGQGSSPVGTTSGIIPAYVPPKTPTPTTPVKRQKNADGSVTEYQQPKDEGATYKGILESLVGTGKKGNEEVNRAIENLTKFRESVADTTRGIYDAPTSARVMQGRDQAIQVANASKEAALSQGVENALTQQQQQIGALGTAAGLAAPTTLAPGNTLTNPVTGETIAGGLGGYVNYNTAEKVMGLIGQYPDINYSYDQNLTPQQNYEAVQQKLQQSPTYQKNTFGVPGTQSVGGATAIGAAQEGYTNVTQELNKLDTQIIAADQIADNLLGIMQAGGINPTDAKFVNTPINKIISQLSSAQRSAFNTALKGSEAQFAALLQSAGGQTNSQAGEAYQTIFDPNASLGAMTAAINVLKTEGKIKRDAFANQQRGYWNTLQGSSPYSSGGSGSGWESL